MNERTTKLAVLGVSVFSIAALLSIPLLAEENQDQHGQHAGATAAPDPAKHHGMQDKHHSMHEMCVKKLDQAIKAIDAATKAVEAGHKATALAELKKAKGVLATCLKKLPDMGKGKFVNVRCPIVGMKLDPQKVPQNLTRMYMGRKVGFCCVGCPEKWDRLSAEEKAEKLGKVVPAKTVVGPENSVLLIK